MRQEGDIGRQALSRARSLLSHGLSLEQILVGTGLMRPEQYGTYLSRAFGVPFLRVPQDSVMEHGGFSVLLQRALEAIPFSRHEERWIVAMTHPDAAHLDMLRQCSHDRGWIAEPRVMLRGDWLASQERPFATAAHVSALRTYRDERACHEMRVVPTRHGADVWADPSTHDRPCATWPRAQASARVAALARRLEREGWAVQVRGMVYGLSLTASRVASRTDVHPLSISGSIGSFADHPRGLMVFIRPDHALCERMGQTKIADAQNPFQQEEVLHRILAGESVIARSEKDDQWWGPAIAANIPVHVVCGDCTPAGRAWSVIHA